jgi:mannitol-1-phosphate 5-dehydrogenase
MDVNATSSAPSKRRELQAVIIGPGRIGCGFAGDVLAAAGYRLTFVGRGAAISALWQAGRYTVRLVDGPRVTEREITGVRALEASDPRAAAAIAEADVIAVSVGTAGLAGIAPLLAEGLRRRTTPVNVLAFENEPEAAAILRREVLARWPAAAEHGFSGALVSRIVTRRLGDAARGEPLVFVGDPASTFVVHAPSLRAPLAIIPGLQLVEDYAAHVQKKLFMFSAGHATAAYLGALKGYRYVHAAIRDREIRARVLAAMDEGRRGLAAKYGPALAGSRKDLAAIVRRFENAALNDPIERVARDPRRKLGCGDRLLGAARLAEEAGVRPFRLALAAAAALCFDCAGDPSACALQQDLAREGAPAVLARVAGLSPDSALGKLVQESWHRLADHRAPSAQLLSFGTRMWTFRAEDDAPAFRHLQTA